MMAHVNSFRFLSCIFKRSLFVKPAVKIMMMMRKFEIDDHSALSARAIFGPWLPFKIPFQNIGSSSSRSHLLCLRNLKPYLLDFLIQRNWIPSLRAPPDKMLNKIALFGSGVHAITESL